MKKNWFTLIEIMIVLLVFSIGILAVLRLILHNMNTMSDLETKTIATLLAKEWLELVYNTRDSNRLAWLPWNCIVNNAYNPNMFDNVCSAYFWDNKWFWTVHMEDTLHRKNIWNDKNQEESALFIKDDWSKWYTHTPTNEKSIFSRYILFTGVLDNNKIIDTWHIVKLEAHVLYQRWSKTGEIILESFIWNY
jgi:type II secretory pathway pseudopilin PulG